MGFPLLVRPTTEEWPGGLIAVAFSWGASEYLPLHRRESRRRQWYNGAYDNR